MSICKRTLIVQCHIDSHRRVRKIDHWHSSQPIARRAEIVEGWLNGLMKDVVLDANEQTLFTSSLPALLGGREVDLQIEPAGNLQRVSIYCDLEQRSFSERSTDRMAAVSDSLYRSSLDALITIDTHGNIIEFNPAAETLFGYSFEEVRGQQVADIIIPHALRDAHHAGMNHYLSTGEGPVLNTRIEVEALRRDGSLFPCELTVVPAEINGEPAFFSAFVRDITERKASEMALTRAKEAAEEASAATSQFLAHMSHEIRSPISAVVGCLELLADTSNQRDHSELIQTARDAGHNLLDIIEDVLSFSKIESGRYQLQPRVFNPVRLLEQIVESAAIRAELPDVHIGCCIAPDVPVEIFSDPVAIRQIFSNLVDNALKFTEHGGVSIRAYVQEHLGDGLHADLRIIVHDTGMGIEASDIERIFDEFAQVDSSDNTNFGGAGLGLAICRRLLEALGGHISVSSKPGAGSSFQAILPCELTRDVDTFAPEEIKFPEKIGVIAENVMLVEDIAEQCRMFGGKVCGIDSAITSQDMPVIIEVAAGERPDEVIDRWCGAGLDRSNIILVLQESYIEATLEARQAAVKGVIPRPFTASALLSVLTNTKPSETGKACVQIPVRSSSKKHRILLAEDSKANQLIALTMLQREGYHVDVVENGREAIDAVRDVSYDLVLMDLRMPLVDGLEATREIRKSLDAHALPIIALTANVFGSDVERCLDAGMNDFLGKPVSREKLMTVMEQWLEDSADNTQSVAAERETLPLVDSSVLEQLKLDTSEEAVEIIVKAFLVELENFLAELPGTDGEVAISDTILPSVRDLAHQSKSSAGYCGALRFQAIAAQLERACTDNDAERVAKLLPLIRQSADQTLAAYSNRA